MSKVRDLPENTSPASDDLFYIVDASTGPNSGKKIKYSTVRTNVLPTASETKTLYESNPNTNDFTDAEKTKLAGIETGATADQIASEVPYNNSVSGLSATNVQDAIDQTSLSTQADFRPSIVSGRILHYTGGTARFDGVFFSVLTGDILLAPNITAGEVYVDLDGLVKQTGSGIGAPPYTIVFAKFSTDLNNITSLIDERVKNSQNIIRGLVTDIADINAGDGAYEGDTGRIADAGHQHAVLTGIPSTQNADQTNTEGVSANLARADHIHNIPTAAPIQSNADGTNSQGTSLNFAKSDHKHDILTGIPSTQNPDQANAAGSSSSLARADHIHNIPADAPTINLSPATTNAEGIGTSFSRNDHTHALSMAQAGDFSTINAGDVESLGSIDRLVRADHQHPVSTASASGLSASSTNTEGVSTSLARADHTHAISSGTPSTQNADQSNNAGTSSNFARADHIHNIPTATPTDIGASNSQGTATTFVKSDHVHKGLHSAKANAGAQRFGDISLINGVGTTVSDDGSGNFTVETNLGPNELFVTQGSGLTANYTAGRVRINGTSYTLTASAITVVTGATNGRIYVDVDGIVKSTTATSTPPNTVPLAIFSSSGAAITALSDNRTLLNVNLTFGASGDITTITPNASAAAGTTNKYADAGHTHAIATAAPVTQNADQSNAEGNATSFARSNHVHNIPTATPTTVSTSSTNTQGTATTFAKSDHVHQVTVTNQEATATADDTTTSLTDTLMNSMTLTPAAGTYYVDWDGSIVNSANGAERTWVSIYLGGTQVAATERSIGTAGGAYIPSQTHAIVTANGSQAIELRWRVAGGTSTVHSRRLTLLRIG